MIGKVYKLSSDTCDQVYIGSTHSKYPSVRMAHHRQNHRRGWRNYHGLFDKGDPKLEILEEIQLDSHDDKVDERINDAIEHHKRENGTPTAS